MKNEMQEQGLRHLIELALVFVICGAVASIFASLSGG